MLLIRDHTVRTHSAPPSSLWPWAFSGPGLGLWDHQSTLETNIIISWYLQEAHTVRERLNWVQRMKFSQAVMAPGRSQKVQGVNEVSGCWNGAQAGQEIARNRKFFLLKKDQSTTLESGLSVETDAQAQPRVYRWAGSFLDTYQGQTLKHELTKQSSEVDWKAVGETDRLESSQAVSGIFLYPSTPTGFPKSWGLIQNWFWGSAGVSCLGRLLIDSVIKVLPRGPWRSPSHTKNAGFEQDPVTQCQDPSFFPFPLYTNIYPFKTVY